MDVVNYEVTGFDMENYADLRRWYLDFGTGKINCSRLIRMGYCYGFKPVALITIHHTQTRGDRFAALQILRSDMEIVQMVT